MPAPILNFEGGGVGLSGYSITGEPPDTEGNVGLNYYVQWTNEMFTIFKKSDASVAYGPAAGNTIWSDLGSGNECADDNDGDPIVQYDQMANRWVMSQFAVDKKDGSSYHECIAVSKTSDPTGSWYLYDYSFTDFDDYPKMGVWPDGYYVTYNMFSGNNFAGGEICAYDRTAMINGDANAATQCFGPYSSYGGLLPADMDGPNQPPSGSPEYVVAKGGDGASLLFWKLTIDWSNSSNSHLDGPTTLSVPSFSEACSGGTCIPQPDVSQQLDSLADRMMYRLAYRNFPGDHESLLVNHSVTGSSADSAVRWYEIRDPDGTPTIYQSGTYEPDSNSRWMGSIAMDHMGNIALGYSVSSGSVYPSIYYTGRLAGDTLGEMTQSETKIIDGTGSQNGHSRWGDYSSMSIDPSDDCTFWYTQEYYATTDDFKWHTRIASFKYSDCHMCDETAPASLSATPNGDNRIDLSWSSVSDATEYHVYRSTTSGGPYTQIGTSTSTTYSDTNVSGGTTYYYVVRAYSNCESPNSPEASATATGACTAAPSFDGLQSVTNPQDATCTLNLSWNAATSQCGNGVSYNIYRSTTSGFTPGSGNQIATGVTGTTYSDTDGLASGTTYYYIVRAVDTGNGAEDTNTVEQSGTPTGPDTNGTWSDDVESYASIADAVAAGYSHQADQGTDDWRVDTGANHTAGGSQSFASDDVNSVTDKWLATPSKHLNANAQLTFWHQYDFENTYDGGVIEISTDGGSTWSDLGNDITSGGYNGTISSSFSNPIGGRSAWTGTQNSFTQVVVDLSSYANDDVMIRWRMGCDSSNAGGTWYIDDISITNTGVPSSCTTGSSCTDPGQPVITSITDNSACAQDGIHVNYTAGSGATSHDLYVDGALAVSNYASGALYDPGDSASHSYVIRAVDGSCHTDSASQSFTDADDTPATPAAPSVSDDDQCAQTGVTVSWSSASGATSYDLLIDGATTITGVSSPYSYNPGDSASHTYQVRGTNATCTGAWSAATSASDADATPATPAAPSVTDISACAASGVTVSWSAATNATSYNVARDGTTVATGVTGTSYTDTPGDTASHSYTVQSVNDNCSSTSGWSAGTSGADADHSFAFGGIQTATDRDACDDTGVVLTWNTPASWNDGGSGTRSFTILRGGNAIASNVSEQTTSYVDTTGTNGTTYSYGVQATNGYGCATDGGATASAADNVGSPPTFDGLQSVSAMSGSTCGLRLEWNAATSNCANGSSIVYNVYRSTTSGFTPDSSNLLASCVTNLYYEDTTVAGGTTYYYIVRAEDSSAGHGGACNGGFEDSNTIEKNGVAGGGDTTETVFYDDFEGNPTPSGHEWLAGTFSDDGNDGNDWESTTSRAHNGDNALTFGNGQGNTYVDNSDDAVIAGCDGSTGSCGTSGMNGIVLPSNASSITLTFWEWRDFEADYDGAMLMYSTTSATSGYVQVPDSNSGSGPYITQDSYNGTLSDDCPPSSGPSGSSIWTKDIGSWQQVSVDLTDLAGQTIWLLWRATTDCSVEHEGWYIDQVEIDAVIPGSTCSSGTSEPLQSFTARATNGQVKLEWVNPSSGVYGSTKICRDTSGYPDASSCTPIVDQAGTAGAYDTYTDTGLTNGTTYYYTAFVDDGAGNLSSVKTVTARPFDTSGQVKWAYSSEATALAPTGVEPGAIGSGGTWAVSNDRMVHGMNPTTSGGDWPRTGSFSWAPAAMNGPAQARPPVVPTTVISGASKVIFLGSEDGHAYAVNAETGATLWQSAQLANILLASPSGMFTDFGGAYNVLFVGSRDASAANAMYMLDPSDGHTITSFDNGGGSDAIGIISSAATVDYANNRIYFASRESSTGSSDTLWCLSFTGSALTKVWSVPLGDIDGAPILYGGRLYVGNNSGIVYAIDPSDGHTIWSYATDDGAVKGYVIPEFTSSTPRKLFFSTTNDIWAVTDNGTSASLGWKQTSISSPSIPLFVLGTTNLYVGSGDGKLYQLDTAAGSIVTSVTLGDGSSAVGSPAMDVVNNMAYVGSESGAVYGIQLPLQ